MEGRKQRIRQVPTSLVKPFHVRPPDLRHPMADEFAQYAWQADFGLLAPSITATPLYTLVDRREVVSETGVLRWEYRGRYQDGTDSESLPEREVVASFTPLQPDVFHALWNLYTPRVDHVQTPSRKKRRVELSRQDALSLFPIGTVVKKKFDAGERLGQVYDYHKGYWRVRYEDNDWEEVPRR